MIDARRLQRVSDLLRRKKTGKRHEPGAGAQTRKIGYDPSRAVIGVESEPLYVSLLQPPGERAKLVTERAVTQRAASTDKRRPVAARAVGDYVEDATHASARPMAAATTSVPSRASVAYPRSRR